MYEEPHYKNELLDRHIGHFIKSGITVGVGYYWGIINNDEVYKYFVVGVVTDFLITHYREIISQFMPNLFIL